MSDKVNPDHYKLPNGIEANDVTRHFGFNEGNVLKYVWRAGKKEGEDRLTDLRKAQWYLNELVKGESNEVLPEPIAPISAARSCDHFVSDYFCSADLQAWKDAT